MAWKKIKIDKGLEERIRNVLRGRFEKELEKGTSFGTTYHAWLSIESVSNDPKKWKASRNATKAGTITSVEIGKATSVLILEKTDGSHVRGYLERHEIDRKHRRVRIEAFFGKRLAKVLEKDSF